MFVALTRRPNNLAMPLALAVMDACWIFAVAWMAQQVFLRGIEPYPVPGPAVLALVWFAGWWTAGATLNSRLNIGVAQAVTVIAGLLLTMVLLLAFYPLDTASSTEVWIGRAALAGIVCFGVWSLGSYRTRSVPDFNLAFRTFITGLVVSGVSFFLGSLLTGFNAGTYLSGVGAIPVWFVGASLIAIALGNRELVRQESGSNQARFWTPVLLGCVLLVLLLSVLGGAVSVQSLFDFFRSAVVWTLLVVASLIYSALYFIFSIFNIDTPFFHRDPNLPAGQPHAAPDPLEALRRRFDAMGTPRPTVDIWDFLTIASVVLVCIVVLVVLFLVGRRLRRTREDRAKNLPEDRESFASWALLKQQVAHWWSNLLARLFRKQQAPETAAGIDELAALRGNPELSGTLSVRQIYARLQAAAAHLGYPRAPQQTPLEYLDVLSRAMPHLRADFTAITSAYLEARYSPMPASAPVVTAATSAWKRAEPQLIPRPAR